MDLGFLIGWVGVGLGMMVPLPQIKRIVRGQTIEGVALGTYAFLCCALVCYLLHAIYIHSIVFTVAQSINLVTNSVILYFILRRRK